MTATTTNETETIQLDISPDNKTTILLNVEDEVKQLISKLANDKTALVESEFIDGDEERTNILNALPNSMTGVVIHYFCKGLKTDFDVEFKEQPVSLKVRATSNYDKKVAGKKSYLLNNKRMTYSQVLTSNIIQTTSVQVNLLLKMHLLISKLQ